MDHFQLNAFLLFVNCDAHKNQQFEHDYAALEELTALEEKLKAHFESSQMYSSSKRLWNWHREVYYSFCARISVAEPFLDFKKWVSFIRDKKTNQGKNRKRLNNII